MLFRGAPAGRVTLLVLALATSACAEVIRVNVESAQVLADEDSTEPEMIAAGIVIGASVAAVVAVVVAVTLPDSPSAEATPQRPAEYMTELGHSVTKEGGWVRWSRCTSLDVCTGEPRREPADDVVSIEELGLTSVEPTDGSEAPEVTLARIRIRKFIEPPKRSPSRSAPPI